MTDELSYWDNPKKGPAFERGRILMQQIPRALRLQIVRDLLQVVKERNEKDWITSEVGLSYVLFEKTASRVGLPFVEKWEYSPKLVKSCLIKFLLESALERGWFSLEKKVIPATFSIELPGLEILSKFRSRNRANMAVVTRSHPKISEQEHDC